jgi:hypothetical protein
MPDPDRKSLICSQAESRVTGIDFVRVADPEDQRQLQVFFLIDPDQLAVDPFDTTADPPTAFATITAVETDTVIEVAALSWDQEPDAQGALRRVLVIDIDELADFQIYRLTLHDDRTPSRIDRFFNAVEFSFKQGCPSDFDCKPRHDCPPEELETWPVDYLARDFESLRNAILDFAAQRHPNWQERIPADVGAMIGELMAALGDELSYIQDRYAREGYLETLTQRRSLAEFARLVDYQLDEGLNARTHLHLTVDPTAGGVEASAGARVWAAPEGEEPVAFELGEGLRGYRDDPTEGIEHAAYWAHALWNDLSAHLPDPAEPCLPLGARELWVVGEPLRVDTLPDAPDPEAVAGFWIGRTVLIETRPTERDIPVRRVLVEIDEPVEVVQDLLRLDEGGAAQTVTRLHWREADALRFELDLADTHVSANIVPATAGLTAESVVAINSRPTGHGDLPLTVERIGPHDAFGDTRAILHRFSLPLTAERGLGWLYRNDPPPLGVFPLPEVLVDEVEADAGPPEAFDRIGESWTFAREMLRADEQDQAFTIEPGTWRQVISFERTGERITHADYASGDGYTLRFGDGTFGRRPPDGSVFRATYRTGPGTRANLPADSITALTPPEGAPIGAESPSLSGIAAVRNPLAVARGRDPEDMALARRIIPEAFRALTFRAVRDEDFEAIAERLDWVTRAGAATRWTGSWLTTFVTPDPRGSYSLSDERRSELENLLDSVRQAGRPVEVCDPVFVDIDLDIAICTEPGSYFGQVKERLTRALVGPARFGEALPFFHPDNWTFGDPLYRTELAAAVATVPGVLAVEEITIRRRGETKPEPMPDVVEVAADRVLRLSNDPRRPDQGGLAIRRRADMAA